MALVLGDNIFYGAGLSEKLQAAAQKPLGPPSLGIKSMIQNVLAWLNLTMTARRCRLLKSRNILSQIMPTGLYFYDNDVVEIAANVQPSARGEIEISDINQAYLDRGDLDVQVMGRGYAWLDTGTHESLLEASSFIATIQKQQNLKVASLEEIAYRMGYIGLDQLEALAQPLKKNDYGQYLLRLVADEQAFLK